MSSVAPLDAAPPRGRLALVLGGLAMLGPLSIDLYLPSFPDLADALAVDVADVQLTLATYLVGLAAGQVVYGPLSDRLGRRGPILFGLALYAVASLLCALAPSLPALAAARFVQALGGCAGMVVTRAVVRDWYDEQQSAQLYASLMLVMGVAPIVAPLLGGWIHELAGWRANFVVLAAVAAAMFVAIRAALPESLAPAARVARPPLAIARDFVGLLGQGVFVRRSLVGGLVQGVLFAYISGSPFLLIEHFGLSTRTYGLVFGVNAAMLIGASQISRVIVPRLGVRGALRAAVLTSTGAFLALWLALAGDAGLGAVLPLLALGVGMLGISMPTATASAMAPFRTRAGLASALYGTLQTAGGALATFVLSAMADGTTLPFATVLLACAGGAALLLAVPDRV